MSLQALLAQLDLENGITIIPVSDCDDPRTAAGQAAIVNKAGITSPLTIMLTDYADALTGDLRAADVLLGLAAQWMLGVDETGDPFVPRTEDVLFFDATAPTGSWYDPKQETCLSTELETDITPLFLFKGTLYGPNISVSLGTIFSQPAFKESWVYENATSIGTERKNVLPAMPHLVALMAHALGDTADSPETRDLITAGLAYLAGAEENTYKPEQNRILTVWIDWMRDRSFQHGPGRANALWTDTQAELVTAILDAMPTNPSDLRKFDGTYFDALSAHDLLEITAHKAIASQHFKTLMESSC